MYLIPASIKQMTAITAVYFIPLEITDERKLIHTWFVEDKLGSEGVAILLSGHPGSQIQFTSGALASTGVNVQR